MNVDLLWGYLYEREQIRLRREAGAPRPWTKDAILNIYKFTNVYREHDRVTRWMAKHVREPLKDKGTLVHACIAFRWFNRISTGEAIFLPQRGNRHSAWDAYCAAWDTNTLKYAILERCGEGPYVTGAYIIKTPNGYGKLDGVLKLIDQAFVPATKIQANPTTLERAYEILLDIPYMGTFTAAQVIADLKYTPAFRNARDWDTFVHSGPGSRAGLNIVFGRPPTEPWREEEWVRRVLELREALIPRFFEQGWEIPHAQDVQSGLCELSKYVRGYSRNTFVPSKEAL